jgi:hypothetical protein
MPCSPGWWGSNFISSIAINENELEMWQADTFDPATSPLANRRLFMPGIHGTTNTPGRRRFGFTTSSTLMAARIAQRKCNS